MALEMSAAEAPDPVPYQEKLGISPEDLSASMAEINKPEFLSVTLQGQENGVEVRPFEDQDMPMLINLDVVTAHEILGDKARIFGRVFFEKHCSPSRTTAMSWRTLTATIQGVPVGFVMYFHYKLRVGTSGAGPAAPGAEAAALQQQPQQTRGGYIDLFWILVHPSHRQVGVGSALIRETQRRGKEEWPDVDQVRLYVMDSNVNALSLYRTHGFERISRRENYPEIGTASYRMVKNFEKTVKVEVTVGGGASSSSEEVSAGSAVGMSSSGRGGVASVKATDAGVQPASRPEAKVSTKMFSPRIEDLLDD